MMLSITVSPAQSGRTVRGILHHELGMSTALLNHLKWQESRILLNGAPVHTNAIVSTGDVLAVNLQDDPPETPITPIAMELDIPYEDEYLLVVNKPAPLAVHASSFAAGQPTLANGLAHYLGPDLVFHAANRLDRGTTGLMVVAKNRFVHNALRQALHTETFHRSYLAVAEGTLTPPAGTVDLPIGRGDGPIRRCVRPDGAPSVTDYETLATANGRSLLQVTPRTGRTHQIRVHMAALGHPLVGDWLYGTEDHNLISRPALHAHQLRLTHPITGTPLQLTAQLPQDMKQLME